MLELAYGGGATAIELAALARRLDLDVLVQSCDLNPESVHFARRNVARTDSNASLFFVHDL